VSGRQRFVVLIGGLKGAVPLLLAGYPALEALPETTRTEGTVLCSTACSILVQGKMLSSIVSTPSSSVRPVGRDGR
jgi:NhaP-type Na+/H+ or K+/H+ antiporter